MASITLDMQPTRLATLAVPPMGVNNDASVLIAKAVKVPQRIVIRNIGAVAVLVATAQSALQNIGQTGGAFEIPIDHEDTFILAVDQMLFASAISAFGRISIMVSDAWPIFNGQPVSC